jgi:hypothetical protein
MRARNDSAPFSTCPLASWNAPLSPSSAARPSMRHGPPSDFAVTCASRPVTRRVRPVWASTNSISPPDIATLSRMTVRAGDIGLAAARPIQRAVLEELDARLRLLDAHIEDQRLAGEERGQFRIHGETRNLDQRPAILGRADAHVVERHGGERDQARVDAAMHHDTVRPMMRLASRSKSWRKLVQSTKSWRKQRRKERHDHQAATKSMILESTPPASNFVSFASG